METEGRQDWIGCLLAAALALTVFLLFRESPELGDDLDYWGLARDLHDRVADAWSARSFHDFRWPVWGPIWLAQRLGLSGLASYYAAPLVYFLATAVVVFVLARACGCERAIAFAGVAIFVLHPFQDTVFSRPMPDLSEGFWGVAALLFWVLGRGKFRFLILAALCLAFAASNRITGVFASVALGVAVLACEPRRWKDLAAVTGMTLGLIVAEWSLWALITGDFLAVLHANLEGRGRAGTGPIPWTELPVRYLQYLWVGPWEKTITILLAVGVVAAWRDRRMRLPMGMLLCWWLVISCAVQGLNPARPMLRTSGRFLAGLSPLLALGAAFGLQWAGARWSRRSWMVPTTVAVAVLGTGLLLTERTTKREAFPEEIEATVAKAPPGSRILADPPMKRVAMLCNETAARRLDWDLQKQMVVSTPELEASARNADEIWFFRSKVWNWVLVDLRSGQRKNIPQLASYLTPPYTDFWPRRVIAHGQLPEFTFLTRPGLAQEMAATSLAEPRTWDRKSFPKGRWMGDERPLDSTWTGRIAAVRLRAKSGDLEPVMAWVEFLQRGELRQRLEFEPPGFPVATDNVWFLEIPAGSDAWRPRVQMRDALQVETLDMVVAPRAGK